MLVGGCDERAKRESTPDLLVDELARAAAVSLTNFCSEYLAIHCARQNDCGRFGAVPTPFSDCEVWVAKMQPACEAHWGALPGAGMATYSPERAGRCVKLLQVGLCSDVFKTPSLTHACVRASFGGVGAAGESCHADLGCQAGLVCDLSAACPGTCTAHESPPSDIGVGGACGEEDGACAFRLTCFEGVCAQPAGQGRACGDGVATCDEFRGWCQPRDGESAICVGFPTAGEECGLGLGQRCDGAVCEPDFGACFQPARAGGDTCNPNTPEVCASWKCSELGKCEPLSWPGPVCPVPLETQ